MALSMGFMTEEAIIEEYKKSMITEATYDGNIKKLGYVDLEAPATINIYTNSFEEKDLLTSTIDKYNARMKNEGKEDLAIEYTDLVGLLMSSISTIINIISYVLIGFVSISLVVSSIMIGIITYISVLERTKEIGILRALGASKKDISRVFNAETGIVGLLSGLVGIGVTVLLTLPINIIVDALTKDTSTRVSHIASLPVSGAIILVIISVVLTLIGGLIPSKIAAKKDPVEALRSE
jgi:putative ABC transport system permease protein